MAALLTLGDAADLTDIAIQDIWLKTSDVEKTSVYSKLFNVVSGITDYLHKDSSMTGLGNASRIVENAVVLGEAPIQGFDKTYTQVEYGKLMAVTKQMWKFGIKKRNLTNVVNQLRAACMREREILCGDRYDQAFATSYTAVDDNGNYSVATTGGDGGASVSATHTREDGGTNWNNRITDGTTVNMDFDYDAIKAAHRTAALITDGKGNLMNVSVGTLVTRKGYANSFRAGEILGAIKTGGARSLPSSAQNDAAGTPDFAVIETPWISTNTAYWWMLDESMKGDEYGFQYKESQPISLEGPNVVFKTGEIQYKSTMMFDIGHNDSRCLLASKNTNAA